MGNLPQIKDSDLQGKKVIVRADLDFDPGDTNNLRLTSLFPTLDLIKEKGGQIIIIGHRGRPDGKVDESLSLKPFGSIFEKWGARVEENLRFDLGEEKNDETFAKKLAGLGDFFVNEAFAVSHREHASIVLLPKLLPHAAGLRFTEEVSNLSRVFNDPKKPVDVIVSGVKEDKLSFIEDFINVFDKVLIGGRLPDFIHDASPLRKNPKVIVADLLPDKEDVTIHSIERFEDEIKNAGTVVLSGPIGKFEEEGHRQGTKRILEAVCASNAFKIAGGGDTESAIRLFNLNDKFDWISVGGGAMLTYLAKKTLPGIEALL